ncbi:nuclear GTP-binding protein nug1 [Cryptotrichosporon argae]
MPKAKKHVLPTAQKRKDGGGVPKLSGLKVKQGSQFSKPAPAPLPRSIAALAGTSHHLADTFVPTPTASAMPVDASLTVRDSSAKAFMRELRKVIERSDVIIQVLDARDPDGTRSRWVEGEVRKRDAQGKKLLAVVNKIDLVPRANLEAWLKYLRHSYPVMPFKSSTQAQRQHLSQNAVPLATASAVPGQKAVFAELPTTSSSLGAPALLDLLKQYALSTPHSALTVGVVGFPNVGKSSLINSLKRSRACGVAAMPGKTRVVQEVVLDKGVKILDCPGVVLEDFTKEFEGPEGARRQAEIMLRNCVKAELIEDPTAPIAVILNRADPLLLQRLYGIPPFSDTRDFLIKIALVRGRLGKGGVPDLDAAALSVLRDWNSGKIPYFTQPPAVHPSAAAAAAATGAPGADDVPMNGEAGGDQILNTLSAAFTIEGLFDNVGDDAAWDGEAEEQEEAEAIVKDADLVEAHVATTVAAPAAAPYFPPLSPGSDMSSPESSFRPLPLPVQRAPTFQPAFATQLPAAGPASRAGTHAQPSRLFTPAELAVLPPAMLARPAAKQAAKKARRRQAAAARTEGELMWGFTGLGVDDGAGAGPSLAAAPKAETQDGERPAKRSKKDKKLAAKARARAHELAQRQARFGPSNHDDDMQLDEDVVKEQQFATFLASVGADDDEEL